MNNKPGKAELYRADRKSGMTYEQIAKKYGVSRQRVAQACGVSKASSFRPQTIKTCVYKNLRSWMNENLISRAELVRLVGLEVAPGNSYRYGEYLRGEKDPPKQTIDKMLCVTGLTYEKLFEIG